MNAWKTFIFIWGMLCLICAIVSVFLKEWDKAILSAIVGMALTSAAKD